MRFSSRALAFIFFFNGCVDRVNFDLGEVYPETLIVDGYISDKPGPYEVKLFRSSTVDGVLNYRTPISVKRLLLIEDGVREEILEEAGVGRYQSSGRITGQLGKKYSLQIEMQNGTIFVSDPEEMLPTGNVDSVYFQFESYRPINGPTQYGFRVFMDATSPPNGGYARWRYTGIFSLETFPQLNRFYCNCCRDPGPFAPLPCSGYVVASNGLIPVRECTCCISYISEPEKKPRLNDNTIKTDGTFKRVEMSFVDINEYSFSRDRYMLKVEQMSLTHEAYEYWKIFRDQKQGSESLFQPAFGQAKTNIRSVNSDEKAGGFFYATSIHTKVAFIIGSKDAAIRIPQFRIQPPQENCGLWSTGSQIFLHSSTEKPREWID